MVADVVGPRESPMYGPAQRAIGGEEEEEEEEERKRRGEETRTTADLLWTEGSSSHSSRVLSSVQLRNNILPYVFSGDNCRPSKPV